MQNLTNIHQTSAGAIKIEKGVALFNATPATAQLAAISTTALSALTTTGIATLSTSQTSNLTTSQLSNLCVNNDLLVTAVSSLQTRVNELATATKTLGLTA